jgi:hypothetical protein
MRFVGIDRVYSDSGVDLTLLRENLRRAMDDRLRRNEGALRSVRAFERECRTSPAASAASGVPVMTPPSSSELNIEGLIQQLTSQRVKFVVIGGIAMRAHGSAHITEDADFCYERSPVNIPALAAAMAPIHPYMRGAPPGLPFRFDAATIQAGLNFTLTSDFGDVDFLGEVGGIGPYAAVAAMAEEKSVFGHAVLVLSIDGLIAAKRAAARRKDQSHLLELEELKRLRDEA